MLKSKWKECSYTIGLCVSFCVVAAVWQYGGLKEAKPEEVKEILTESVQEFWERVTAKLDDYYMPEDGYAMSEAGYAMLEDGYAMSEDGYAMPEDGYAMPEDGLQDASDGMSGDGEIDVFDDVSEGIAKDLPMPGEVRFEAGTGVLTEGVEDGEAFGNKAGSIGDNKSNVGSNTGGMESHFPSGIGEPFRDDGAVGTGPEAADKKSVGTGPEAADKKLVVYQADKSYFDDALFIGDSRTVGLYEYGGLGNAEVFADSGMSIYKIFKGKFTLRSGEEVTLEQALSKYTYGKVYIMLGINELGYDFENTVERFGEAIARIRQLQPKALIFIQANLHIAKGKSEESEIFNNSNINKYNEAISKFADGEQIFYLDVNPMYDDEEGYLSMEYTTDQAHILGKYYVDWVDFILKNAVKEEENI